MTRIELEQVVGQKAAYIHKRLEDYFSRRAHGSKVNNMVDGRDTVEYLLLKQVLDANSHIKMHQKIVIPYYIGWDNFTHLLSVAKL